MGTVFAIVVFAFALNWARKGPSNGLVWIGMLLVSLGLIPLATITSFHPYTLLGLAQWMFTPPLVPLGFALMLAGRRTASRA